VYVYRESENKTVSVSLSERRGKENVQRMKNIEASHLYVRITQRNAPWAFAY
jgi:hypothetical protein